jgi:ComF family protein
MPKLLSKAGIPCLVKLGFYDKNKYNEPQNKIIYFLKHNKNKRAAGFIAKELVTQIKREAATVGIEDISAEAVISWIPRSRKAKVKEGHDQSELVCQQLSEMLSAPNVKLILRKRGSMEQKKLDSKARSKNIKNSFVFNKKLYTDTKKAVILFDDIVTTGASMAEAVSLLRKNGVKTIICVTIATVM